MIEAVMAIGAGIAAGSVALTGFGFDSAIEVFAAALVLVRLRVAVAGHEPEESPERRALRAIAVTFFALTVYHCNRDTLAAIADAGFVLDDPRTCPLAVVTLGIPDP